MAKTTKKAAKASKTTRTRARVTPGGKTSGHRRGEDGLDANDPTGAGGDVAPLPSPVPLTDSSPQRPQETEFTRIAREHESALATGQVQPHPTMAPRAAATAPDNGPVGRAHQPLSVIPEGSRVGDGIKVRATRMGEYAHKRRREGDVFVVTPREGIVRDPILDKDGNRTYSKRGALILGKRTRRELTAEEQLGDWMEPVDGRTPEKVTTSGDVMPKKGNSRPNDDDTI